MTTLDARRAANARRRAYEKARHPCNGGDMPNQYRITRVTNGDRSTYVIVGPGGKIIRGYSDRARAEQMLTKLRKEAARNGNPK